MTTLHQGLLLEVSTGPFSHDSALLLSLVSFLHVFLMVLQMLKEAE